MRQHHPCTPRIRKRRAEKSLKPPELHDGDVFVHEGGGDGEHEEWWPEFDDVLREWKDAGGGGGSGEGGGDMFNTALVGALKDLC